MAFERISIDPTIMGGLPCVRGQRLTVSTVLGQLAIGCTVDQVIEDYPYLAREDVLACLDFAAAAINEREMPVARPA